MLKRTVLGVAMAALTMGLVATLPGHEAEAKTSVNIWIGMPGMTYWNGPGYYGKVYRSRLTCSEGRWIVDRRGYHSVYPIDCNPRYYRYHARRGGWGYVIRFDSWNGRIVSVRPG